MTNREYVELILFPFLHLVEKVEYLETVMQRNFFSFSRSCGKVKGMQDDVVKGNRWKRGKLVKRWWPIRFG